MQACMTKFFKPVDPARAANVFEYLFQKEEADRLAAESQRREKIKEERKRERARRKELAKAQLEAQQEARDSARARKLEIERRKYEGLPIVPGVYLGSRLAAMNEDWIRSVQYPPESADGVAEHEKDSFVSTIDSTLTGEGKGHTHPVAGHFRPLSHVLNVSDTVPNYFARYIPDQNQPEMERIPDDGLGADFDYGQLSEDEEEDQDGGDEEAAPVIKAAQPLSTSTAAETADSVKKKKKQRAPILPLKPLIYHRISVADSHDENIAQYFEVGVSFMAGAVSSGGSVLVHCREGRSRSVSMVIAYLVMEKKMTLLEAYTKMEEHVLDININEGFKRQLMELDMAIHQIQSINFFDRTDRVERVNYDEKRLHQQSKPPKETGSATNKETKQAAPSLTTLLTHTTIPPASNLEVPLAVQPSPVESSPKSEPDIVSPAAASAPPMVVDDDPMDVDTPAPAPAVSGQALSSDDVLASSELPPCTPSVSSEVHPAPSTQPTGATRVKSNTPGKSKSSSTKKKMPPVAGQRSITTFFKLS